MTATNHALTGAVIALAVGNPWLAVPLAFLSHFAVDALPHWDYAVNRSQSYTHRFLDKKFVVLALSDLAISLILFVVLGLMFPADKWLIWICMAAAGLPDGMWLYYRIYLPKYKHMKPKLNRIARFHQNIQWSQTAPGGLIELGWFVLMLTIIRQF